MTTPEAGENTMSNTLDEILAPWVGFVHSEYDGTSMVDDELAVIATAKQQIEALITGARIEGGQVSINTEIPKKITGFESMPAMSICRNLTIQDAKINEIIDYLSQLALKENK